MKKVLLLISLVGLVLTIFPSILYLFDVIAKSQVKGMMIAGTLIWFVASIWKQRLADEQ